MIDLKNIDDLARSNILRLEFDNTPATLLGADAFNCAARLMVCGLRVRLSVF